MSTSALKKSDVATVAPLGRLAAPLGDYLGPATVVAAEGPRPTVELTDGTIVVAELALQLPYEPALGDSLLVVGRGANHYVIGVLHGTGRTALTLQGDVDLHASGGALSLSGDKGVQIRGPELEVQVDKLRMMAAAAVQTFTSLHQRVRALLSVQAGEAHTLVENTSFTKAKNATLLTEETVTVNGKQIHLG
jgi:hypothetical protein